MVFEYLTEITKYIFILLFYFSYAETAPTLNRLFLVPYYQYCEEEILEVLSRRMNIRVYFYYINTIDLGPRNVLGRSDCSGINVYSTPFYQSFFTFIIRNSNQS